MHRKQKLHKEIQILSLSSRIANLLKQSFNKGSEKSRNKPGAYPVAKSTERVSMEFHKPVNKIAF